jgi:hypothetical protein
MNTPTALRAPSILRLWFVLMLFGAWVTIIGLITGDRLLWISGALGFVLGTVFLLILCRMEK